MPTKCADLKNIKTKEHMFWQIMKKTTGNMIINTFLDIGSRPEEILLHLHKFYTACT